MSAHTPVDLESCSSSEVIEAPPRGGAVRKPDICSATAASEAPPAARVAWEEELNTTEHTNWWKAWRKLNPFKRPTQTHETEVCVFEPEPELPHTSSAEPTAEKQSKLSKARAWLKSCWKAVKLPETPKSESFHSLYDVGKKIRSSRNCRIYWGYRNSDDKRVLIKFIHKRPTDRLVKLPGYPGLLSQEAFSMLRLQKTENKNIVQLYDLFLRGDEDILVLERPRHYVSLLNFFKNGSHFTDDSVRHIIQQLIHILKYCMDCGVYPEINIKKVLIHPCTLHVKLVDIRGPLLIEERREDESVLTTEGIVQTVTELLCQLLEKLVKRISNRKKNLSEVSLDLLMKLRDKHSQITLDGILDHALFKQVKESRQNGCFV